MAARTLHDAVALLEARDWQGAHAIAQESNAPHAAWAHGIVHLIECDESNARYWYRRAGRAFPRAHDPSAEIDALVAARKKETE